VGNPDDLGGAFFAVLVDRRDQRGIDVAQMKSQHMSALAGQFEAQRVGR
jgi:hypothetical protein